MFLRSTRDLVLSSLTLGHQIICCLKKHVITYTCYLYEVVITYTCYLYEVVLHDLILSVEDIT